MLSHPHTRMPLRSVSTEGSEGDEEELSEGDEDDEEEVKEITVEFEFFGPEEKDFLGLKALLSNYLNGQQFDSSGLIDAIIAEVGCVGHGWQWGRGRRDAVVVAGLAAAQSTGTGAQHEHNPPVLELGVPLHPQGPPAVPCSLQQLLCLTCNPWACATTRVG